MIAFLTWRVLRLRLFDQVPDRQQAGVGRVGLAVQASIQGDRIAFNNLRPQDRRVRLLEGLDHLLQTSDLCIDDVIRQNHRERLIADQFLGHQHSMAQAERLGLQRFHAR